MSSQFWWILDLLTVIIAGYVIYSNGKRGITKVLILSIGYVVSTFFASILSVGGAVPLYEAMAQSSNITAIEAVQDHLNLAEAFADAINAHKYGFTCTAADIKPILVGQDRDQFDIELYEYACKRNNGEVATKELFLEMIRDTFIETYGNEIGDRLPEYAKANLVEQVKQDPNVMRQIVSELYDTQNTSRASAEHVEALFAQEPTIEVFKVFIYLIIFSVLMAITALISSLLQNKLFFNLSKSKDHALGAVVGIFECAVMLMLFTVIVRLLVLLGGNEFYVCNEKSIAESLLFHHLYDHINILL